MKAKLKDRWIKALESGDFKQGINYMCRADEQGAEYCPIGVLVELVEGENIWRPSSIGACILTPLRSGKTDLPPKKFLDKVGLSVEDAAIISELNDIQGLKFPQIAKIIKINL